ncbi:MAG TPA: hypothetical protein VGN52_08525 [Burkholderiales bacterium]
MKNVKLLTAAALLFAAAGAYAGTDDGNVQDPLAQQAAATVVAPAPAPAPSAALVDVRPLDSSEVSPNP